MLKKKYMKYVIAFLLYCILIFMANWSLISGVNLMKWDIFDAQYPNQMITSDAISNGQFPLWNPLFNYGTPNYAQVGTPIWYVFSFLFNIIGYGPSFPGIEYSFHMLIAAMGMFCLAYDSVKGNIRLSQYVKFAVSFCAGSLYAFSGIFLSNAEHIMIIISAAWIPFVLFFTKKAITSSYKLFYVMLSGILAGFVLSGGYPEQFVDMFIVVFGWMLVWSLIKEDKSVYAKIKRFIVLYAGFAISTAMSAAITLIPFLKLKNQITRGGGQTLLTYSFESILSAVLPVSFDSISGMEISMGLFYVGIITIISLPLVFKLGKKNHLYLGAALIALFLAFGSNSFLYSLFYRFVPMYSTFRFPSVWRAYWALFSILAVIDAWGNILEGKDSSYFKKIIKISSCGAIVFAIILWNGSITAEAESTISVLKTIVNSILFVVGILFVYYVLSNFIINNTFSKYINAMVFIVLICAEVLAISHRAMPVMIAKRDSLAYYYDPEYRAEVDNSFKSYNNRNKTSDFADSYRTTTGRMSVNIGLNKTIDEGGYVSIILADIQKYKETYNRSITQKNPIVYFTNDIVSSDSIKLDDWLELPDVNPYQIHVSEYEIIVEKEEDFVESSDNDIVSEQNISLNYTDEMNSCFAEGQFTAGSNTTTRLRVYVSDTSDNIALDTVYVRSSDGSECEYSGNYKVISNPEGEKYAELSLPRADETYSKISFKTDETINKISIVEYARNAKDKYANIEKFGYNDIKASVNAVTDGMLVVMQSAYDGWKAYVDGKKVDIKKVNDCFIGVQVDEGNHVVELRFEPLDFKIGVFVSVLYLILFITVCIFTIRKVRMGAKK